MSSTTQAAVVGADRARQMWRLLEPVHAVVYFAHDARDRFEAVGLKRFWMGYFASRSAPLGPVGPELVQALFYVFHPAMVARALPDAWRYSTPEQVLAARSSLADSTLHRALGELADGPEVATAADLASRIASAAPLAGRPLGAAHAALPRPADDDHLGRLWWAATVLREHRFDGHVAALLSAGIDPCESLILAAATGAAGGEGASLLQATRKWPNDEWSAATERLKRRGWLDGVALTEAGHVAHQEVEDATDRAASTAYAAFSDKDLDSLATALQPLVARIAQTGALPFPNPVGLDPR
jgi:hypothetical protein